jgi:hypothetical protein
MGYSWKFYGKTFNSLGNSNIIAYKAYPCDWKFHGIVWTISGNFMELSPADLDP